MSKISEDWITNKREQLKIVTENYSSQEKQQVQITYLNNLLSILTEFDVENEDVIIGKIEIVINALPKEFEEFKNDSYQPLFYDLEFYVKKRFNLIPKHLHRNDFNSFSKAKLVGYISGGILIILYAMLLMKPVLVIVIGIPLITLISALTGIIFYKKEQKENRVLK